MRAIDGRNHEAQAIQPGLRWDVSMPQTRLVETRLVETRLVETRLVDIRLVDIRLADVRSAFLAPAAGSSVVGRFGWIFFSSAILVSPSDPGASVGSLSTAASSLDRPQLAGSRGHNRAVLFITFRRVLGVTQPM
jgi:hypothetical protein